MLYLPDLDYSQAGRDDFPAWVIHKPRLHLMRGAGHEAVNSTANVLQRSRCGEIRLARRTKKVRLKSKSENEKGSI